MSSINVVDKARARTKGKPQYKCHTCHETIEVGQAYSWFRASRFTSRFNWHTACKRPAPSVLETNEKRATAMAAFEAAYEAIDNATSLADLIDAVQEAATGLREAADAWHESAQAIEDGFQHATSQSEEMNERGDEWEAAADELDNFDLDDDYTEEDESWTEGDDLTDAFNEWLDAQRDAARDAIGEAEAVL